MAFMQVFWVEADGSPGINAEQQSLELADVDHTLSWYYNLISVLYPLPESMTLEEKSKIISAIMTGLAKTLTTFPILLGSFEIDESISRLLVRPGKSLALAVKHFDQPHNHSLPSFAEMKALDFPIEMFKVNELNLCDEGEELSPYKTMQQRMAVAMFQLTFIRGGLIISSRVHHAICDIAAWDMFSEIWATHCRAVVSPKELPSESPGPVTFQRSSLKLNIPKPTGTEWEGLSQIVSRVTPYGLTPLPPVPSHLSSLPCTSGLYHFSMRGVGALMRDIKTMSKRIGEETRISAYSALMGITWRSIVRARMQLLGFSQDSKSIFVHPVSLRPPRKSPMTIPENYFGNAFLLASTEPVSIACLLSSEGLAVAASKVQQSILAINNATVEATMRWFHGVTDLATLANVQMRFQNGPDVFATSWQTLRVFQNHDFGFGLPQGIRIPGERNESVVVYPRREGLGPDEGYEVGIVLEAGCQKRLAKDMDFRKYTTLRGTSGMISGEPVANL